MRVPPRLPEGWERAVRSVLPERLAEESMVPLGSGLDCWAVGVGPDVVLRIPQNDEAAAGVERDQALLPELAVVIPVAIPAPLFVARNPLGPGRLGGYRLVRGAVVDPDGWRERRLLVDANAAAIARIVEAISSFPAERARALGVTDGGGRQGYADDLERVRHDVGPLLPEPAARELADRWRRFTDDDANFDFAPVLLHADLSLDHLLVVDGAITGVIDFGDVELGDPDAELGYLWAEAGPAFVARIQAGRGRRLTAALAAKLAFFQLADEVGDAVWGIDNGRPEVTAGALERLTATLGRSATGRIEPGRRGFGTVAQ